MFKKPAPGLTLGQRLTQLEAAEAICPSHPLSRPVHNGFLPSPHPEEEAAVERGENDDSLSDV